MNNLKLNIRIAWWFIYIYSPLLFYTERLIINHFDAEFKGNEDKYQYWFKKAITAKAK